MCWERPLTVLTRPLFRTTVTIAVCLSFVGCSCETRQGQGSERPARVEEAPELRPPSIYGLDGELKESDTVIAGLTMPMGITLDYQRGHQHSFSSAVPMRKLQTYFGPRLNTADVERVGDGAIFRRALPAGEESETASQLDVSILSGSSGVVRVNVMEYPPADTTRTEAQVRAAFEEASRRLD